MKKVVLSLSLILGVLALATSCKKGNEDLKTPALEEYYPLKVGKSYLYRLDSTVLAPFGTAMIVHSYQAKDSVEATFTDNEGRLSYRIFRFTRDTAGLQPWASAATFIATPTATSVEYVDNNMRFLKLAAPLKEGFTWSGHRYIDTKSLSTTVQYLDGWEYEYRDFNLPYMVRNISYDSTVTVFQHDENTPDAAFNPANYYQHNNGYEVYAKGVGMIYKEFLHWTWQTTPAPAKYEDGSYGVKLTLISHN